LIAKVVWVTPKDFDSGFRLEVTVVNANDPQQPVYDARLYWYCDGELYGRDSPEDLGTVLATATAPKSIRAARPGGYRLFVILDLCRPRDYADTWVGVRSGALAAAGRAGGGRAGSA
jgi:hypothetical protein